MLRTILIDDEVNCLKMLEWELKTACPEVEVLAKCETGKDGLKAIKDFRPDLVFLDVEMPYMNGFEMLELAPQIDFEVVFTTAYDEYAVRAFKISAIDYLLKPIDSEELRRAVEKVLRKKQLREPADNRRLDLLMETVKNPARTGVQNIALPTYD
ncbi:MAG: response regulator, partial [Bacteroidetes bacterium]